MTNSISQIADQIHKANEEKQKQKLIAEYLSEKCYMLQCELSKYDNQKVLSSEEFYAEAENAVEKFISNLKYVHETYGHRKDIKI